jgi:hypothetical protein
MSEKALYNYERKYFRFFSSKFNLDSNSLKLICMIYVNVCMKKIVKTLKIEKKINWIRLGGIWKIKENDILLIILNCGVDRYNNINNYSNNNDDNVKSDL